MKKLIIAALVIITVSCKKQSTCYECALNVPATGYHAVIEDCDQFAPYKQRTDIYGNPMNSNCILK